MFHFWDISGVLRVSAVQDRHLQMISEHLLEVSPLCVCVRQFNVPHTRSG